MHSNHNFDSLRTLDHKNVIFIMHTVVVVLLLMLLVAVANLCQTSMICNFQYIILDSESHSHEILNLEPYTQYKVTVQVFNPEGLGPETTILVMTDEGDHKKSLVNNT
uniref:Fibronectin type-III domain-containing protein n=1 Tax=Glossina palpalis gambiensis TaxID=67801 RepID=A0A1B0B3E1_9MUSC